MTHADFQTQEPTMTRTTITRTGHNYVTLTGVDPFDGQPINWTFMCANVSGRYGSAYVRNADTGKQVCEGLSHMGPTLTATPDTLVDVIRKEWRKYHTAAKRW